jgi:hypothetical protein
MVLVLKFTVSVDHLTLDHFDQYLCAISGAASLHDPMWSDVQPKTNYWHQARYCDP